MMALLLSDLCNHRYELVVLVEKTAFVVCCAFLVREPIVQVRMGGVACLNALSRLVHSSKDKRRRCLIM